MAENAGGTAAPVDNSPSFAEYIGDMMGGYTEAEPESDAGAPPDATPEPASSEGLASSEPAGAPPAEADAPPNPDPAASEALPDVDPFDGSRPLDYTVDGTARAFDGITVLKDGHGIIDPTAMERVQRVFGERDHLFEQNKTQYDKYSSLERATSWQRQTGVDGQGKATWETITGQPAIEAQRISLATFAAKAQVLDELLSSSDRLIDLISEKRDASGAVIGYELFPAGVKHLKTEMNLAIREAQDRQRKSIATLNTPQAAPAAAETPVAAAAQATVSAIAGQLNVSGLTPEDNQFLADQLERYVRPTTPQEKQAGLGARIVDASFGTLVKRTAAQNANTAKVAASATTAASANAARLAAASIGGKGKQPARIVPTKEPERTRGDDFDEMWDRQEKASAGALRGHAAGR